MTECIKPKLYGVMHNRYGDDTLHRRMLKAFPHTVGFIEPMERKIVILRWTHSTLFVLTLVALGPQQTLEINSVRTIEVNKYLIKIPILGPLSYI